MRLFEIIQEEIPVKTVTTPSAGTPSHRAREISKKDPAQYMGGGSFADIYGHKDAPHDVLKISRHNVGFLNRNKKDYEGYGKWQTGIDDAYMRFILAVNESPSLESNPYFPKIRSVKKIVTDRGVNDNKGQYMVRMERLFPIISSLFKGREESDPAVSSESIDALIRKMFKSKTANAMLSSSGNYDTDPVDKMYMVAAQIAKSLGTFLGQVRRASGPLELNRIEDPELIKALIFLRQLVDEDRNLSFDINIRNMMFRQTPYGLQLVFTDPVA